MGGDCVDYEHKTWLVVGVGIVYWKIIALLCNGV